MDTLRRLLAVFVLLISVVVLLAAMAAVVGLWVVRGPATERLERLFDRADAVVKVAQAALARADGSLAKAAQSLNTVKEKHQELGSGADKDRAILNLIAMGINSEVAPEVQETRERLLAVTEAAVVLDSVLGDLNDLPAVSVSGPEAQRLGEIRQRLAQLAGITQQLGGMLNQGQPDKDALGSGVVDIDAILTKVRALVTEYTAKVAKAQEELAAWRARAFTWITIGVPAVSVLLVWIALGQVSLIAHAVSWLKERRARAA
jgi:hypothetical protein